MKRALLIAFHFPPAAGSSGVHRSDNLARYLRDFGWDPLVVTANERAHPVVSEGKTDSIADDVCVLRTAAWDAARHFSIAGYYPDFFAWPDRWVSWFPSAVFRAVQIARRHQPDVIWSTYPIVTSHLIARATSKITGLPWIADFRDSMTDSDYPPPGMRRKLIERIESKVVHSANRVVFTAPGTRSMYASRYPTVPAERWRIILNGYDQEKFSLAEHLPVKQRSARLVLLHSGCIYPQERDPTALFEAIGQLHDAGQISPEQVEIRLRASAHDDVFRPKIKKLGIEGLVTLAPPIGYVDALAEMLQVDGLLLLQAASCNHQIPAKAFEYIRAGKPILALTDGKGDTAQLLSSFDAHVAPLDSVGDIARALLSFFQRLRRGSGTSSTEDIAKYSRKAQVERTALLFDEVVREIDCRPNG